jgi:DNA-binding NarL/FixJ family response regulator
VVVQAIRLVLAGGVYLPAQIMTSAAEPTLTGGPSAPNPGNAQNGLTDRQREVLSLLRLGLSNKEIARDLGLSPNTVKIHVKAVLRALNVTNRTQAATAAATPTDS